MKHFGNVGVCSVRQTTNLFATAGSHVQLVAQHILIRTTLFKNVLLLHDVRLLLGREDGA